MSSVDVVCRMYREGDEYGIVKLFHTVFGREMTLDEWRWKYRGQGNRRVYAVVLDAGEVGIVGHFGGIPLRMIHDGALIKGAAAVDTMIHPKFRSFVRFREMYNLFMDQLLEDSVVMYSGFSPDKVIRLAVDRLGIYERVEQVHEAVKAVRYHNDLARFLYELSPLSFDDERVDVLWESLKKQFRLAIVRDRDYFVWRYKNHPLHSHHLWGLRKRWKRELTAVAVVRSSEEGNMLIMDIVSSDEHLPALLSKVENLAHAEAQKRLFLWLPNRYRKFLSAQGFSLSVFHSLTNSEVTLPRSTHPLTLPKEEISGKFFYTMGDTDYL